MKITLFAFIDRARACAIFAGGVGLITAGVSQAAQPAPTPIPSSYSAIPAAPPSAQSSQRVFSDYAWQTFIAVNWPAKAGARGVPDTTKSLGAPGLTVWQTYKTTGQVFLPKAADPGPWNSGAVVLAALQANSKAPKDLPLPPSIQQAVGGWLIDTASNPTYYEIAVNQTEYEYVRSNQFYNADVLNKTTQIAFPDGSLEIKAAWRIMATGVNQSRYLTLQTQVMTFDSSGNPTGTLANATVGLVGLHVIYRAKGFPQWIWATFEQVDNVPLDPGTATPPSGTWSYFNAANTGQYGNAPWNVSPKQSGQPFGSPNQITRLSPIRPDTAASNTKWQQFVAGTPFQYYQLISPQWPSDPNDPGNPQGTPTPGTVANCTMESYIQPTSSCMDCHSTARVPNNSIKTNYSFIFLSAKSPSN